MAFHSIDRFAEQAVKYKLQLRLSDMRLYLQTNHHGQAVLSDGKSTGLRMSLHHKYLLTFP